MIRYAIAAMLLGTVGPAWAQNGNPAGGDALHPRVDMETSLGTIVLELDAESAPYTVQNFVEYARSGFYEGTIFHRVMSGFMIQGGGLTPELDKKDGLRPPIVNEWRNGLKNDRGTISMARQGGDPDSATAQFFINVVDNPALDRAQRDGAAYAVFGKVVEGMDVVEKIRYTPVAGHPKYGGGREVVVPKETILIKSVKLVSPYSDDAVAKVIAAQDAKRAESEKAASAREQELLDKVVAVAEQTSGKKMQKSESGLMWVVLQEGSGASPAATDTVKVHYTGWLLDGKKFDSSVDRGRPATFPLNRVISGWTEGVGMMKVGEKRTLVIPSDLAYGDRGRPPTIPPKATLHFEVELLEINPKD